MLVTFFNYQKKRKKEKKKKRKVMKAAPEVHEYL